MILQGHSEHKQTIIEDDVWIGRNVSFTNGRHVYKGTIIALGCVHVSYTHLPNSQIRLTLGDIRTIQINDVCLLLFRIFAITTCHRCV